VGNVLARWIEADRTAVIDREPGANLTCSSRCSTPIPICVTTAIVALMVLEHQVGTLNRITEAQQYFRNSLRLSAAIYPELSTPTIEAEFHSSSLSVAQSYAEKVLQYLPTLL